jgi:formyltetrahydrofolate synthetase
MIDIYLMNDIREEVKKICKKKYRNGIFDFSGKWKEEFQNVMSLGYSQILDWIAKNR